MQQTDCELIPTEQIEIFQVKNKPVVVCETRTEVSSNTGFLVLGVIDRKCKLTDSMTDCFQDAFKNRMKSVSEEGRIEHSLRDLLTQRVYQIALGYEDGIDANDLRHDSVLQLSIGKSSLLGSQPMMSRLENWVSRSDIYRGWGKLIQLYAKEFYKAGEPVVIDIDSTNDPVHGQLGLFNGYYKEHCFHPLLFTEASSGFPFGIILRNGPVGSAHRVTSLLGRIIRLLREAIPGVEIILKGDCAFGVADALNWLDKSPSDYILGLSGNAVLYREVEELKQEVILEYEKEKNPLQRFRSFSYRADTWDRAREVVAKVEHTKEGMNIRFVVSSMKTEDPEMLYRSYCTRAKGVEAIIEQLKNGLRFDKTACHRKVPNQMRYFESALALILHLKLSEKMEKKLKRRSTVQSLIQRVLKVAAIVKKSTRRFLIELSSTDPHTELLFYALQT